MTYADNENRLKGQPVEVYRFTHRQDVFLYTSSDEEITVGTETYVPHPIVRDNIVRGRLDDGSLDLTIGDLNSPIVDPFRIFPNSIVFLQVIRLHRDDPGNIRTIWDGEIFTAQFDRNCVKMSGVDTLSLTCREGLRSNFSTLCNNYLFDQVCGLNLSNFALDTTVATVSPEGLGFSVVHPEVDNYYAGGVIFAGDALSESRTIQQQVGANFVICIPFANFNPGDTIRIVPGCDRRGVTCRTKYNNYDNFRGFEAVPLRDPHRGFGSD